MNVYEARHKGREYCNNTEGSEHYKEGDIEPLDLAIAQGTAEGFCITNISKYAYRFRITRNCNDLRKASDYAQILCGLELTKSGTEPQTAKVESKWDGMSDEELRVKVCDSINNECKNCPLFEPSGGYGMSDCTFPDFRRIAIEYLEKEGKA